MAQISTADIDNLPDDDFAYIEPGGHKDSSGRTEPRSLRHFPIQDAAHVRDALSRAPQSPFGEKAMPKIHAAAKKFGVDAGDESRSTPNEGTLTRGYATDLTIDGRTIVGLAVPFNRTATVSDDGRTQYKEAFERGAFAVTISQRGGRVRAHAQHKTDRLPIGKASHLEETADGLVSHLRVSDTTDGNDVLALVRDGVMTGLSIGFRGLKHSMRSGVKVRTEVALSEISVVSDPAYADAQIHGIRQVHDLDLDELVDAKVRELFASRYDPAIVAAVPDGIAVPDDPRMSQSVRSLKEQMVAARSAFLQRYGGGRL